MGPNVDGISVYYNNNKKKKNIVFFEGGQHAPYADGEMLAEFITEEAFYMVTDKAFYAISSFPDRAKRPTKETIANGFLWLCGLVEDDDFPVVSAIFRSSFSSAIQTVLNDTDLIVYGSLGGKMFDDFQSQTTFVFFDPWSTERRKREAKSNVD